jgi:electron transport complex protein RnfG
VAGEKQPGSFRLVATLALTGLMSGLVLVGIYLITQPRILRNQAEALYAAIYRVLPGTKEIRTFVVREGQLVSYESSAGNLPDEQAVYPGHREVGSLVGYAVPAS